jgi:hypothetical protein
MNCIDVVMERMTTHPEEFFAEADKWKFLYKDYFRDVMTESEKGMIFERIKKIRREELSQKILQTLVPPEETELYDHNRQGTYQGTYVSDELTERVSAMQRGSISRRNAVK